MNKFSLVAIVLLYYIPLDMFFYATETCNHVRFWTWNINIIRDKMYKTKGNALHKVDSLLSDGEVIDSSTERLRNLSKQGGTIIGYLYPHTPIELFLAHGLTPSLMRVDPQMSAGFEDSLQTFACAFTRNVYSQRAHGGFIDYSGFLFPGNTCDALQNVGDVWRQRFSEDTVLRLTYPVSPRSESTVSFLAEEMRLLSKALERQYGKSFSQDEYSTAVSLVNSFRTGAQFLYASRIVNPETPSYRELVGLVVDFMVAPVEGLLRDLDEMVSVAKSTNDAQGKAGLVENVLQGLMAGTPLQIHIEELPEHTRLLVLGGMVDPFNLAELVDGIENATANVIALDMLSFSFKSIFTPTVESSNNPYISLAKAILGAPLEPTQEGLQRRMAFLRQLLETHIFDGIVVCEQSFCDPDEFEAPSMYRIADEIGIPSLRLPIDPELSDRGRLEGRIQTFLETLEEDK